MHRHLDARSLATHAPQIPIAARIYAMVELAPKAADACNPEKIAPSEEVFVAVGCVSTREEA